LAQAEKKCSFIPVFSSGPHSKMAPELPKKFDDISKKAAGVFKDDFQTKDFSLVAKQKSNFLGASSEITVPVFPSAAPKLSFKIADLGVKGVVIDKFELDKDGKAVVESSISKALHSVDGLKLEVKSNFDSTYRTYSNLTLGAASTYTGIANTSVKVDIKQVDDPTKFTVEASHAHGSAVVAAKFNGLDNLIPDVGVNYTTGDLFAAVVAKGQFTQFNVHALYQATAEAKVAATYQHGGKGGGEWAVGAAYQVAKDTSVKAKFESSQTTVVTDGFNSIASVALKKELAKGTTLFGGVAYALSGKVTYGVKIQIE